MNGLDIIIRDNLRWQARAEAAAHQRGQGDKLARIVAASPLNADHDDFYLYAREHRQAWLERAATRGL